MSEASYSHNFWQRRVNRFVPEHQEGGNCNSEMGHLFLSPIETGLKEWEPESIAKRLRERSYTQKVTVDIKFVLFYDYSKRIINGYTFLTKIKRKQNNIEFAELQRWLKTAYDWFDDRISVSNWRICH